MGLKEKEFKTLIKELSVIDLQREIAAERLLKAKNPDQIAEACIDLHEKTEESTKRLKRIKELLLNFIILEKEQPAANSEGIRSKLISLSGLIEKNITQIRKLRKKQASWVEHLVKFLNRIESPLFSYLYKRNFKKIKNSLKREIELMNQIKLYQHTEKEMLLALGLMKKEKIKKAAVGAVAGVAWLTPGAGTVLTLAIFKLFGYVNQYSQNYRELQKLLT